MDTILGIAAFAGMAIAAIGMSHFNLTADEKAALDQKPMLYRGVVRASKWIVLAVTCAIVLSVIGQCLGRIGGSDCDFSIRGEVCGPS